tara:strand:+ start:264 stop:488 length:225 start_codon:yes stop_codon:yes gene_type:complete
MKHINLIQKILNEKNKKKISEKKKLEEFVWDSMTMITLITILKDKYNKKNINLKKMRSLKTILDLDNFINSYTK